MDKKDILEIMQSLDSSSLAEIRIKDGEFELTVKKAEAENGDLRYITRQHSAVSESSGAAAGVGERSAASSSGSESPGQYATETAGGAEGGEVTAGEGVETEYITAPIVGTVYRSPSPDSPPYVEEDAEVEEGRTLCIVEAMKVMNELEAEFPCRIVQVLVEDKQMVEYGTPLFEVERLG